MLRNLICVFVLLLSSLAFGQQCEIAVNAIKTSGDSITGLGTTDFTAEANKRPVSVDSAQYENEQSRRVILVFDTDRKLPANHLKLETDFANSILDAAKPGDSFGLLTSSSKTDVKLGSDREAVRTGLGRLLTGRSDKRGGTLDRVADAIDWFGSPQLGDSVVVFAIDTLDDHKISVRDVTRRLAEHQVRLFGVSLGKLQRSNSAATMTGTTYRGLGEVRPENPISADTGDPDFLPISVNSGGYLAPQNSIPTSDAQKLRFRKTAELMAGLIDQFYAVRVKAPGNGPIAIGLAKPAPDARLLYSHTLPACGKQ